jgi:hypothetical protein
MGYVWAIDERRGLLSRPLAEPVQLTSGTTGALGGSRCQI